MSLRDVLPTNKTPAAPTASASKSDDEFLRYLTLGNRITPDALERAKQVANESKERLVTVFTRLGLVSEGALSQLLADYLELPIATARDFPSSPVLEDRLPRKFLEEKRIIPLRDTADALSIAVVDPLDPYVEEALRFAISKPIKRFIACPSEFEAGFARLYGDGKTQINRIAEKAESQRVSDYEEDIDRVKDVASEAPIIRLVNHLITQAVEARASDIHIEPMENALRVRYRIDGILQPVEGPPQRLASSIVSRIKIMAKLNIAEKRLAQDGRISFAVRGKDIDFRVSTVPTTHGESVVLRILDRGNLELDFAKLGFEEDITHALRALLAQPHGIFLVTGPTGSGKTTTLYAALLELNTPEKKILTIEDPVEYQLDGINQVQVKPQIGLGFANALRAFLRQDPDIMMIGEIRDLETAQIAVQAALTGHLILSTLHTNDAASAVTRLLDMGLEDYLLTSTINGVAAQRLVRTLCRHCREPFAPLPVLVDKLRLASLSASEPVLFRPKGCDQCNQVGYRGRTSIIEVLPLNDPIRQAILKSADAATIQKIALESGLQTMQNHGLKKALTGVTTIDEVMRVTRI